MTPRQVVEHFGTVAAAARALKIKGPSFYGWIAEGRIPIDRQCHIEVITAGALLADREELGPVPAPSESSGNSAAPTSDLGDPHPEVA